MLQPAPYPYESRALRKYRVLQAQAAAVGLAESCYAVPQTNSFESYTNVAGVDLHASSLSGQESTGSNDGSKNSTLVTYLADAWCFGSDIFCGCDVRYVQKHHLEGYLVFFRQQGQSKLSWVHARKFVFMGAGSLGTTEIILRSREHGLSVGPSAGSSISSNGSMLAFGYDLNRRVNSVGTFGASADPPGPTIVGTIDCRDSPSLEQQFMIQDGAFPTIMAAFFRVVRIFLPSTPPRGAMRRSVIREIVLRYIPKTSRLQNCQCYLVLGHDNSGGSLSLTQDQPSLDLRNLRRTGNPGYIKKTLIAMTHALGGTFLEPIFGVVVHPLGGMAMSRDGTGKCGATTHTGEVLSGEGTEVHEGLVVMDGALISRSLATNPLATICALAERAVQSLADTHGLSLDLASKRPFEKLWCAHQLQEKVPLIEFSETMSGDLIFGASHAALELSMNIKIQGTQNTFSGSITGTARCVKISPDLINIEQGNFILFEQDQSMPMQRNMIYNLDLITSSGVKIYLHGSKKIHPTIGMSPLKAWRATTTLATTLSISDGSMIGKGELRISFAGFLTQLRSLRVLGPTATANRKLLLSFLLTFTKRMCEVMFVPFVRLQYPADASDSISGHFIKPEPDHVQQVEASDGVTTALRMWQPLSGKTASRNLLFIPGGAVTHEIYALPTINVNAVDYFTARGYRCWCITHRAATVDRAKDKRAWTTFDARLDIEAALKAIRRQRGRFKSSICRPLLYQSANDIRYRVYHSYRSLCRLRCTGMRTSRRHDTPSMAFGDRRVSILLASLGDPSESSQSSSATGWYLQKAGRWLVCLQSSKRGHAPAEAFDPGASLLSTDWTSRKVQFCCMLEELPTLRKTLEPCQPQRSNACQTR